MHMQCDPEQPGFSCAERRRVVAGKLDDPLAGKSRLNRLELFPRRGLSRYHRIRPDGEAIEPLFVELFLDFYRAAPAEIVLYLDATDMMIPGSPHYAPP
jgi:hypothetical protein